MASDTSTFCPDASFKYLEVSTGGLVVSLEGDEVRIAHKNYQEKEQHWRYKDGYIECFDGRVLHVKDNSSAHRVQIVAVPKDAEAGQLTGQTWTLEADGHIKNGNQSENWLLQKCDLFLAVRGNAIEEVGMDLCVWEKVDEDGQHWMLSEIPEDIEGRRREAEAKAAAETRRAEAAEAKAQAAKAAEAAAALAQVEKRREAEGQGDSSPSSERRRRGGSKVDPLAQGDSVRAHLSDDESHAPFDDSDRKNLIGGDKAGSSSRSMGKMPNLLNLKMPDGSERRVVLAKPGGKLCLGLPPPPGGWYGPFGFLRLVAYAFVALGCFGVLGLMYSVSFGDVPVSLANILLIAAACLAAIAAEAHEGLASQVTQIAHENDKFARKNVKLASQVDELQSTEERITKAADALNGDLDQLSDVVAQLNKITNLEQVNTMISAFLDAERNSGHCDLCLSGEEELHEFWSGCRSVVKKELPGFDLDELHDKSLETGLPFICVSLVISAVLRNCEGQPHEFKKHGKLAPSYGARAAKAFLNTVLFALDPQEESRIRRLEMDLESALPQLPDEYSPMDALHSFLLGLAEEAKNRKTGPKIVSNESLKPFARALKGVSPWPGPHGQPDSSSSCLGSVPPVRGQGSGSPAAPVTFGRGAASSSARASS